MPPIPRIPEHASAQEAIAFYQRLTRSDFCTPLGIDDPDDAAYVKERMADWQLATTPPVEAARLQAIEEAAGFRFAPPLRALYEQVGSFSIHDIQGLTLFPPADDWAFLNAFANYNYSTIHTEYTDLLSPEQLQTLQAEFFFFAIGFYEDDGASSRLLYIHKQEGYFGELLVLEGNHPQMKGSIYPQLFAHTDTHYSLDALLRLQLNRLIVYALVDSEAVMEDELDGESLELLHACQMYRY